MNLQLSPRRTPSAPTPGRSSLPQPVAAVLTDRLDDVTVADTAACLAASRGVPLLLATVLPPSPASAPGADGAQARAVLGRVLPRIARHRTGRTRPSTAVPARGGPGCGPRPACRPWPAGTTHLWWPPPAAGLRGWTRAR